MNRDLVSIIMPAYNCEKFISETIDSVLKQSYQNWELIIVDDCSTDSTADIVKEYADKDSRVKYFENDKNSGAAISRNNALKHATGRFMAFLDSDDLWRANKLEKQIEFMIENNYGFSCTEYDKIDENSDSLDKIICVKEKRDYHSLLKTCPGNSTVMYDTFIVEKQMIPDIKKRNDYVMWLQLIKKAEYLYGLKEVLGSHRVRTGSISSNKISLVKYHWYVYRKIEKLSIVYSIYLLVYWVAKGILKK